MLLRLLMRVSPKVGCLETLNSHVTQLSLMWSNVSCFHNRGTTLTFNVQVDRPGLPSNTVRHSMPGSATDESKQQLQYQLDEGVRTGGRERAGRYLLENGRLIWEDGYSGEEEEDLMRELNFSGYAKLVEDTQLFSTTPLVTQSVTHVTVLTREVGGNLVSGGSDTNASIQEICTLVNFGGFELTLDCCLYLSGSRT